MTTIADSLQAVVDSQGLTLRCRITPSRLVRLDYNRRTRVITVAHAARILAVLRECQHIGKTSNGLAQVFP
jgi:hypothetical protein